MRLAPPTLLRLTPLHLVRAASLVLVAAIALSLAHLTWLLVTPLGPVGGWQAQSPRLPDEARRMALIDSFDPFAGPSAAAGPVAAPSDLTLVGVRQGGRDFGGAIIELPDGTQASFSVGEEILPGLRLDEVHFDHVLLDRGGVTQRLALEGADTPVPVTAPGDEGAGVPSGSPIGEMSSLPLSPRMDNGQVTGLSVTGDATMLAAFGLKPGDVITAIRGRPVKASDLQTLRTELRPGARIALSIERGAGTIPLTLSL